VSDAELVARARAGAAAAFGELVDRHRAAVFRAALWALGSRADADDAAQLEDGKSITVAQSKDPIGDRQVTLDVTAAIMK
jgi:hypothetical protein